MTQQHAYLEGLNDGRLKSSKSPSRGGYPGDYDAGYRHGLLQRSRVRRALDRAGNALLRLAERT